jgi:DNA-binding GntR family transcriptional regulator
MATKEKDIPAGIADLGEVQRDPSTLSERVYQKLRTALIGGRLSLGEVVTLRGVATMLGTSVTPVREAILRLASEGALELLPNRLIRVPELSLKRFRELIEMRILNEGEAVARAAKHMTAETLEVLARINKDERLAVAENKSYLEQSRINQEFQFTIFRLANNELQLSIIEMLWLRAGPYIASFEKMSQTLTPLERKHLNSYNTNLLKALKARDSEAARKALTVDLQDAAKIFERVFGEQLNKVKTNKG